ncbi:30S ribosome-binding factor RbfA [Dethiothermospora halolimnae]|uniref:30S ribosome-binding factor RbfA n=1 Tax=Dethiothermospora halolimnae TaxID=3114390 RepID=UPI003CCC1637
MGSKRLNRIAEEIKKVVSSIIANKLKDPRISTMTSITKVTVTRDLRYAKIYVGVLGNEKEKKDSLNGLKSAKGFIRRGIGETINLRYTPEPLFYLDESIEHGIYISKLIDKVNKESGNDDEKPEEKSQ